jgi:hypothetical protein
MKVKEWVDGGLVLDGDILEGAEEAFKETRYVEAFALLHAYIDWWMTDLIQLSGSIRDSSKTYALLFECEYRFRSSAKILLTKRIVDGKEYGRLLKFNELRDKIIHRLVIYSYQHHARNKVTGNEIVERFEEGKALALLLRGRTSSVILNPEVIKGKKLNEKP